MNRLLRLFLPEDDYVGISGDLKEEYDASIRPRLGPCRAGLWLWGQALRAIVLGTGRGVRNAPDGWASGWGRDFQYAARQLGRAPVFSIIVILTLALGIGANAAIFSFVQALLLRPFPFPNPDRLVQVYAFNGSEKSRLSLREVTDLNQGAKFFEGFAAYRDSAYNYGGDSGPAEHLLITRTTENLFRVLGVEPARGSAWPAVNDRSRSFLIVLTHDLWVRRFQSDPNIVGKVVSMDGFPNTVAGVAAPKFNFPSRAALFRCWGIDSDPHSYEQRDRRLALAIGRLKTGVSIDQGRAELAAIGHRLARDFPATNSHIQFGLSPLRDSYVGAARPYLLLLLGAVGFVLLIACVNVANLLLSRAASRRQEVAIRVALGASRARLIRGLIVESLFYSVLGGLAGLLVAFWAVGAISHMIAAELPPWMEIRIDSAVLLFLFGLTLLTGLLSGIIPAFRASRRDAHETLKQGSRGSAGRGQALGSMVMAEVAFAVVLLVGAALMMQSFLRLQRVNVGFVPDNLLTFHVGLSWKKYSLERARAFEQTALDALAKLPGVRGAALSTGLPFTGRTSNIPVTIDGQTTGREESRNPLVAIQQVSWNYHNVMGIPLVRGRYFSEFDQAATLKVSLVSERLAKRLWPGQNPIGKRLLPADLLRWTPQWLTVVGVVGNVKQDHPAGESGLDLYVPFMQAGSQVADFVLRTSVQPAALTSPAPQAIAAIDREEPVSDLMPMREVMEKTIWQRRLAGMAFSIFGGLALILAAIGIYGVIAYSVSQRTREIGIRAALGARRVDILRMVLRQGATLILPGIVAGLAGAFALSRVVSALLFEISATDPLTFAGAAAVLTIVALLACLVPARRAVRVDPLIALRSE